MDCHQRLGRDDELGAVLRVEDWQREEVGDAPPQVLHLEPIAMNEDDGAGRDVADEREDTLGIGVRGEGCLAHLMR